MIGMKGFVAQGMDGRKSFHNARLEVLAIIDTTTTGVVSITASKPCQALIYAFGPGGSGASQSGGGNGGGGGGGALFKSVRLAYGQIISATVGTPGASATGNPQAGNSATDTVVTLPTGQKLVAGGGAGGTQPNGGAGGVSTGGDINRTGGAGGANGNAGSSAGTGGGAGGGTSVSGGGGGGAGFGDIGASLIGGAGSAGTNVISATASSPGGGGGGGANSGAGGAGRVIIWLVRTH